MEEVYIITNCGFGSEDTGKIYAVYTDYEAAKDALPEFQAMYGTFNIGIKMFYMNIENEINGIDVSSHQHEDAF